MTQAEFLKSLRQELERSQVQNISDILADYEEHFQHGLSKKKSEEEIALGLGFPSTIAKAYKTESLINEINHPDNGFQLGLALNIVTRLLVIAPFNFIVLFIPGIIIFSLMTAGWSVAVAFLFSGIGILSFVPSVAGLSESIWSIVAAVTTSLGLLGMACVTGMLMFLVSKYILLALINYLQWNLKFITQK